MPFAMHRSISAFQFLSADKKCRSATFKHLMVTVSPINQGIEKMNYLRKVNSFDCYSRCQVLLMIFTIVTLKMYLIHNFNGRASEAFMRPDSRDM